MRKMKIGLALGGGGARGLAHIGVIRVLKANKIPIDMIAGTSMGAVIGAMYALEPDINMVEEKAKELLASDAFKKLHVEFLQQGKEETFIKRFISHLKQTYLYNLTRTKLSLVSQEKVEGILNELLPDRDISETKIPFVAVATDLTRAEEMVFNKGPLRKAVQASMAIAGIFPPLQQDGNWLIDGGIVSIVPVKAAFDMGADMVIAVDVKSRRRLKSKLESGFEIISRANYIRGMVINQALLKQADIVISPGVKNVHWADFKKIGMLIKKGEQACESELEKIKDYIRKKELKTFLNRLFS